MTHDLEVLDMHTAGEPVRIVTGGYPALKGATILDKRRDAKTNHDALRRALMLEPRGHAEMYGVIPVAPSDPRAVFACLFMHGEGYSTMCGHATIALGRWLIESGRVPAVEPQTRFSIEVPCGVVDLVCDVKNGRVTRTAFDSVPAFLALEDLAVHVDGIGAVICDVSFGGAFYAVLPSSRLGLDFFATPLEDLRRAAMAVTARIRSDVSIAHPVEPDLGFLYGTILTDDAPPTEPTANLCVFAEGQIDRSPTGSGVTARLALDHAKGRIGVGVARLFRGPTGVPFEAKIAAETQVPGLDRPAVTVRVAGTAHNTGEARFRIEPGDPLGGGFALAPRFTR
ncbi:MAG TPA: proline racemase family protein [Caulobacteraceae bacterium]|jgi:trans-L-3-hydroxyproline dehydratase|nr:proline racemase family protein [Caulobacteraceae bacterium]